MKSVNLGLPAVLFLVAACSSGSGDDPAPVNQAPEISAIAAQSTVANGASQPIAFSLSDEAVNALTITASSDRQQLVPDSGLTIAGSGVSRTLTVNPVVDMTGDAMITIIVRDAENLAASSSFLLTVTAEQKSMQQFTRDNFVSTPDDEPELINAVEFAQDADDDDFADLLAL